MVNTDPHVAGLRAKRFAALPVGRYDVARVAGALVRFGTGSVSTATAAPWFAGLLVGRYEVARIAGALVRLQTVSVAAVAAALWFAGVRQIASL